MAACRLIVHGDDFGLSERVNEGIVHAHRRGILTSTSLMASGRAFEHALQLAKITPTLDVGIHLTLTAERPALQSQDVPTLVENDGALHADAATFTKRYVRGAISLDDVERELRAQIGAVVARGISPTHLDGHQHLHILPGIRRIVGKLASEYRIPCVRYPRERLSTYMLRDRGDRNRLLQLIVLNAFCAASRATNPRYPEHFFGFFFGGRLTKKNLLKVLEALPARGTCELMCHPGLDDPDSRYNHWGYRWKAELDALTDTEVCEHIKARSIELISYADIAK